MRLRQPERQHGQQQAGHVGEVVPGVGEQPHRTVEKSDGELHDDESHVEDDPHEKRPVERRDPVLVVVMEPGACVCVFVFVCHVTDPLWCP